MREYVDDLPDWQDTPLRRNKQIKTLLAIRDEASDKEKLAKEQKSDCSEKILSILKGAGLERVRVDDFSLSEVTTERHSLNEGELKKALLKRGMKLTEIEALWESCSSSSASTYLRVTKRNA